MENIGNVDININMNKEEFKKILKEVLFEVLVEQKYVYRTISPPEIVKSARGILNLDGLDLVPAGSSKLAKQINNRKIMDAYTSRMSTMGFQLVTDIQYIGLPYGGNLAFRKPIQEKQEAISDIDELAEPVITEGLAGDEIFFEERAKLVRDREFTKYEEQEKKLPLKLRERHKSVRKTININEEFKKKYPGKSYINKDGEVSFLGKKFTEMLKRKAIADSEGNVEGDITSDIIEEDN